jgi:hypothetical protein
MDPNSTADNKSGLDPELYQRYLHNRCQPYQTFFFVTDEGAN